ncbi:MAG: hypothetical protein K8E24_006870 [Methanobacterium paludis]|uniref:Uncharacterized protein n=1 Tax=Methanobacterium paludis (strain DSM 25820 / JCM 18151 / SWAN1) TaxID=868131 RepID=F6D1S0_METPW|nr:hypothetical protein [Methanobacterium paludis]AEG17873.1 hypothetical protein MSWAN_0846 [Methanobacterium paludis]MCE7698554.1 hypothetical protein [Methanobacterium paludis]
MAEKTGKKIPLKLSLDENAVKQAKEQIPNISRVIDGTLNMMLETQDTDEFKIKMQIRDEEEQIIRSENRINVLHGQLNMVTDFRNSNEKEVVWSLAWKSYRSQQNIPDELLKDALTTFNMSKEDFMALIKEVCFCHTAKQITGFDAQNWTFVHEQEQFERFVGY